MYHQMVSTYKPWGFYGIAEIPDEKAVILSTTEVDETSSEEVLSPWSWPLCSEFPQCVLHIFSLASLYNLCVFYKVGFIY